MPSARVTGDQIRAVGVPPGLVADVDQVLREHGVDAQPWVILRCLSWLLRTTPTDHLRDLA